jgi:hypothetical protein
MTASSHFQTKSHHVTQHLATPLQLHRKFMMYSSAVVDGLMNLKLWVQSLADGTQSVSYIFFPDPPTY